MMMKVIRSVKGKMPYHDMKEKLAISEWQLQREFKNQNGNYGRKIDLAWMNVIITI
jgi:hypothetical protein